MIQIVARDETEARGKNARVDGGLLHQSRKREKNAELNPNYLYVNRCTTDNIDINPAYLTDIHEVK